MHAPESNPFVEPSDADSSSGSDFVHTETYAGKAGHWKKVSVDELERAPITEPPLSDTPASTPAVKQAEPRVTLHRRQALEQHIKSNPTDLDAFLELAQIYRSEQRPIEAKRVLGQAVQIFPDDQHLLWELEEAILARSLQQLREVADLASRLDTAETDRELQRSQQDWANRRIEICQARLKRDPSLVHLRVALGEALHDAGMYEAAVETLETILGNDELSPTAHLLTGKCLLAMKKELEAMASFRACALRRSVVAPLRTKVLALRLLCETADRLGITLTTIKYREQLQAAERELAKVPAH